MVLYILWCGFRYVYVYVYVGQLTRPPSETSNNLRRGIQAEHKLLRANYVSQETFSPKVYASLSDAIDARLKTVSMLPGNQTMARSSAELLVRRGSKEVQVTSAILTPQVNACSVANIDQPQQPSVPVPVPVRFTHDSALLSPSLYYSSEEQVRKEARRNLTKSILLSVHYWSIILVVCMQKCRQGINQITSLLRLNISDDITHNILVHVGLECH